jgi:hypothetical protein
MYDFFRFLLVMNSDNSIGKVAVFRLNNRGSIPENGGIFLLITSNTTSEIEVFFAGDETATT